MKIFIDLEGVITKKGNLIGETLVPLLKDKYSEVDLWLVYERSKISNKNAEEFFDQELVNKIVKKTELHENAKELLEELKEKKIYIASNHMSIIANYLLEKNNLKKYFQKVFVSSDLEKAKPWKDFFEKIKKESNAKKTEKLVFIDDAKTNLETAKKTGFITIWVNNKDKNKRNKINYKPDYEVKNLLEIPEIIKNLKGTTPSKPLN